MTVNIIVHLTSLLLHSQLPKINIVNFKNVSSTQVRTFPDQILFSVIFPFYYIYAVTAT